MVTPLPPAARLDPPAGALALVPGLEQGGVPQLLQRLSGGSVNHTWRVDSSAGRYTLRLDAAVDRRPGVDRRRELLLHAAVAEAAIAPRIVRASPETGVLICEFLDGRCWTAADFQQDDSITRLGERLAALHALRPPAECGAGFEPLALVRHYLELAGVASEAPHDAGRVLSRLRGSVAQIEAAAKRPCIVHGDLPYGNVLENSALWLLDWEYAQLADPVYDVAGVLACVPLSGRRQRRLLAAAGLGNRDAGCLAAAVYIYRALTWAWKLARGERAAAPEMS
jgi:aminoglycoside phosphotransferase (APT) family kinase protein